MMIMVVSWSFQYWAEMVPHDSWLHCSAALTFTIKTQLKHFLMINEALMKGFVPKTPRQKPKQKYLIH